MWPWVPRRQWKALWGTLLIHCVLISRRMSEACRFRCPQFTGHDVVNFGSGGSWSFDAGYSENAWASFPTERHKVGTRSLSARDSRDPKTRSFLTDLFAVYCCGPHSLAENLCFSELSRLQCEVLHNSVDILTTESIF